MFGIEDYDYNLPEDLIAQVPNSNRDGSRLLVLERQKQAFSDHFFSELPRCLKSGDILVINNTEVVPARLFGNKETGGQVEVLVLEYPDSDDLEPDSRWCLLRSSKRPKRGSRLLFEMGTFGLVEDLGENGLVKIAFSGPLSADRLLAKAGRMPLPPYIKRERDDDRAQIDRERYQTVFARKRGAVAAPTAGLHFSKALVGTLKQGGIDLVELTLHVGHGTFKPVKTRDIRDHQLGEEAYTVSPDAADAINASKLEGRRVIAVGTTVVRVLETLANEKGLITPGKGTTELLITPGFRFRVVDALVTNFHLPRSSLLFLVSAFAGLDLVKRAYNWAVEKKYRFYSYGDAMLII